MAVLVFKLDNTELNMQVKYRKGLGYFVKVSAYFSGIEASMKFPFDTEKEAEDCCYSFDFPQAMLFYGKLKEKAKEKQKNLTKKIIE
jgi:hypothetical protein